MITKGFEEEHAAARAEHDRTGEHHWLEVTIHTDSKREFICLYCPARKSEEPRKETQFDAY